MVNNNSTSTILSEHRRIVSTRFWLALINFLAIAMGTGVTLLFVTKRGCFDLVLKHIYALLIINALQILLCLIDGYLRHARGIYWKALPVISYVVGVIWLAALVGELYVGTLENGVLRIDLLSVAIIQLIVALWAYIVWPKIDKKSIDSMTLPGVRDNPAKRLKKAKKFVALYVTLCLLVVMAQAVALMVYKLPPRLYDLFSDSRALQYQLSDDGEGYVVTNVYRGTSSYVNIPSTYNNKPVVGIASGALIDDTFGDQYRVTEITIGEQYEDENGNLVWVSNLQYIEYNAIANNKIETLSLPASVQLIQPGAIKSTSLTTVEYSAAADFSINYLECDSLKKIIMTGSDVGRIYSLDGIAPTVTIEVSKDIYNQYREDNLRYVEAFRPILADNEFCIDFYTNCDYYIDSIFCTVGDSVYLAYTDLKNSSVGGVSPAVDTLAYIRNPHELGTNGIKADSAFRGWYYDNAYSMECVFPETGTVKFSKNVSLYAKWITEYTAVLDWGTYKPVNAPSKINWTDEDVSELPVITDREGYAEGVHWYTQSGNNALTTTQTLTGSTTLYGRWTLDAPEVDITHSFIGDRYTPSHDGDHVHFTYNETSKLVLQASHNHPLDGVLYNNKGLTYSLRWVKSENAAFSSVMGSQELKLVADAGTYTLHVTARSPYGETSTASTQIQVEISRKQLDMGSVLFSPLQSTYNGRTQSAQYSGQVASSNVSVTYKYYDASGRECLPYNAGTYTVEAVFQKIHAAEAANYETAQRTTTLTIAPAPLTFISWEGADAGWQSNKNSFVYNGSQRAVKLNYGGIFNNDTVTVQYSGQTNGKNAGSYSVVAISVSNPNYTLTGMTPDQLRCNWKIEQKPVTVKHWLINGVNVDTGCVIYNGGEYNVRAELEGVVTGETVGFDYYPNTSVYKTLATNAGTYTARVQGIDNSNYYFDSEGAGASYNWTIAKRQLTLTFSNNNLLTYNGSEQNLTAILSGFANNEAARFNLDLFDYGAMSSALDVSLITNANNTLTFSFGVTNAGAYTASVWNLISDGTDLTNNYALMGATSDFTIQPKKVFATPSIGYVYNGTMQELTLELTGFLYKDLANLSFEQFDTTATAGRVSGSVYELVWNGKNAGSYAAVLSDFNYINANYELASAYNGNLQIARKPLSVDGWKLENEATSAVMDLVAGSSHTYNFYGYTAYPTISGMIGEETVTPTLTTNFYKNVGRYTVSATLDTDTYINYSLEADEISWHITEYVVNLDWQIKDLEGFTFTYDGTNKILQPIYTLLGTDTATLTYSDSAMLMQKDAGVYSVTVMSLSNTNYKLGTGTTKSYTITPKTVTVNWVEDSYKDLVYNGQYQGPNFSLTGIAPADLGALTLKVLTTRKTFLEDTSDYVSFDLTAANSYTFLFAVDAGDYGLLEFALYKEGAKDGNYVIEASNSFRIAPKTITLSGNWSYVYANVGTSNPYTATTALVYNKKLVTLSTTIASGPVRRLGNATVDELLLVLESSSAISAGSYTAKVTGLDGTYAGNYALPAANTTCNWRIAPKPVVITWTSNSFVYSGNTFTQTATIQTGATSDTDGKLYTGDTWTPTYSGNTGKNATSYTAKVTAIGNSNYVLTADSNTSYVWTIAPLAVELVWTQDSFIYNGGVQYPTASFFHNGKTITVTEYRNSENTDAGSYTVEATTLSDANYTLASGKNVSKQYTITPLELQIEWLVEGTGSDPRSGLIYDGQSHTVKALITNLAVPSDVVNLTYDNNTFKNAGDYTVCITDLDNDNYTLPATGSVSFNVAKKLVTFTWLYDGVEGERVFVYDGKLHTLTAVVNGAVAGETLSVTSYQGDATSATNASTVTVKVLAINDPINYTFDTEACSKPLVINRRVVTLSWTTDNTTYDGSKHSAVATVTNVCDGDTVSLTYSARLMSAYGTNSLPSPYNTATAAGVYSITVSAVSNANYTLEGTANATETLTIAQKLVTLSWSVDNANYNGATHQAIATVTNACVGDTVNVFYLSSTKSAYGSISSSANGTAAAGQYLVTANSLSNTNYTLESAENTSATLTITPQKVKVTWNGTTNLVYNGSSHNLTATIVGAVTGDSVSFNYASSPSGKNVGTYTYVISSLKSTNYTLEDVSGSLEATMTITPRVLSLTWPTTTYTYNGRTQSLTPSINNKAVSGDVINLTYRSEKTTSAGMIGEDTNGAIMAGSYRITVVGVSNSNYTIEGMATPSGTFTIAPQKVTISWYNSTSVVYDGNEHFLYATARGSSDNTVVGLTYTQQPVGINVGSYTYAISGLTDPNYTLSGVSDSYLSKTLTITKRTISLSWQVPTGAVYNGNAYTLLATASNRCGADDIGFLYSGEVVSAFGSIDVNSAVNAGTYRVTVTGITNTNYTLEGVSGTSKEFTIAPAYATVKWPTATTATYNGLAHSVAPTVTGLEGESVAFTYGANGNTFTNAGTYTITISSQNTNYTVESAKTSFTFTVDPAVATVTWPAATTVVYNGRAQSLTPTVTGLSGAAVPFVFDEAGNAFTDAGTYTVSISLQDSNYVISTNKASVTFTIAPAVATVVWPSVTSVTYDGTAHSLTPTVTGLEGAAVDFIFGANGNSFTNVGVYTVTIALQNSNYTIGAGMDSITFTINPATATVTWPATTTVTYNATAQSLTPTVTGVGGAAVPFVFDAKGNSFTNAGSYTVTIVLRDSNYTVDSNSTSAVFTITPAKATVTWPAENVVAYDGENHTLVPTVTGIGTNVPFIFTATGNAANGGYYTDAGTYTFTIQVQGTNYVIDDADATAALTITPVKATVAWPAETVFTYDGTAHSLTPTLTGVNGETVLFTFDANGNTFTDAGTYQVTVLLKDSNYTLDPAQAYASLIIKPAKVTVTWPATTTVIYNGKAQSLTPTVTGVGGAAVPFTFDAKGNSFTNAGSYTVTIASLQNSNYSLEGATLSATLTIAPATVTLAWELPQDAVENGSPIAWSVNDKNGADVDPVYTITNEGGKTVAKIVEAGTYTITVTAFGNTNYTVEGSQNLSATLTVAQEQVKA